MILSLLLSELPVVKGKNQKRSNSYKEGYQKVRSNKLKFGIIVCFNYCTQESNLKQKIAKSLEIAESVLRSVQKVFTFSSHSLSLSLSVWISVFLAPLLIKTAARIRPTPSRFLLFFRPFANHWLGLDNSFISWTRKVECEI